MREALRASRPAGGSSAAGVPPNKTSTIYTKNVYVEFKIVWNKFRILSRFVSYPVALNLSCILEIRVDQPKQSLLTGPCRVSWGLLNAMYFEGYQICILRVTIVGYRWRGAAFAKDGSKAACFWLNCKESALVCITKLDGRFPKKYFDIPTMSWYANRSLNLINQKGFKWTAYRSFMSSRVGRQGSLGTVVSLKANTLNLLMDVVKLQSIIFLCYI